MSPRAATDGAGTRHRAEAVAGTDPRVGPEGADEGFLTRWSRRKLQAADDLRAEVAPPVPVEPPSDPVDADSEPPTDADLPPLESLDENSDYSAFLSPRVSEKLRGAALRKLFHAPAFNVVDGLDDYAEDYRNFAPLGDIVTAHMRHRMEVEAERMKAKLAEEQAAAPADEQATASAQGEAAAAAPATGGSNELRIDSASRDEDESDERSDDPSA